MKRNGNQGPITPRHPTSRNSRNNHPVQADISWGCCHGETSRYLESFPVLLGRETPYKSFRRGELKSEVAGPVTSFYLLTISQPSALIRFATPNQRSARGTRSFFFFLKGNILLPSFDGVIYCGGRFWINEVNGT